MFTQNAVGDQALLARITAAGGFLNGALIGLTTNNLTWNKGTDLAAIVEPTFAGYARIVVVWTGPFRAVDGTYRVSSQLAIFQPTAASVDTIAGYFLVEMDGLTLIGGDNFPAPVPLPDALARLAFTFDYSGSNAAQGTADQVS